MMPATGSASWIKPGSLAGERRQGLHAATGMDTLHAAEDRPAEAAPGSISRARPVLSARTHGARLRSSMTVPVSPASTIACL